MTCPFLHQICGELVIVYRMICKGMLGSKEIITFITLVGHSFAMVALYVFMQMTCSWEEIFTSFTNTSNFIGVHVNYGSVGFERSSVDFWVALCICLRISNIREDDAWLEDLNIRYVLPHVFAKIKPGLESCTAVTTEERIGPLEIREDLCHIISFLNSYSKCSKYFLAGWDNKICFVGTRGIFQIFRPSKRELLSFKTI